MVLVAGAMLESTALCYPQEPMEVPYDFLTFEPKFESSKPLP